MKAGGAVIEEIVVPDSEDGPAWHDFIEYVRVRNDVEAEAMGSQVLAQRAGELVACVQEQSPA